MFGYILAIFSALSFSLNNIFLKKAGDKLNTTVSLILVYIFVSIITLIFSIIFGNYNHQFNFRFFILTFLVGLFGAIGIISFLKSFSYLSVAKTLAIANIYPFITLFINIIFFNENLIISNLIAMFIVFLGIIFCLNNNFNSKKLKFNNKLFYPLITAFGWALYYIFLNLLSKENISSFNVLFYSEFSIFINIILFYLFFIRNKINLNLNQFKSKKILINSFIAAFFASIGVIFFILSLQKISVSISASIISSQVIFSSIFAYFIFNEKLNKKQIFGILIVVFGLILFQIF